MVKISRKMPAKRAPQVPKAKSYHHGDLRKKLISATELLIMERGVDGFSLREVARRANVSPAAPSHHFVDARGLLSEVALLGFVEFGDALAEADRRGGDDPAKRLIEQGQAYVTFATRNPARFTLMFRADKCDMEYAPLATAALRSFRILEDAIRAATGVRPGKKLPPAALGLLLASWSIVHGFAHLALGGKFDFALEIDGANDGILKSLLPLTLQHLPLSKRQ